MPTVVRDPNLLGLPPRVSALINQLGIAPVATNIETPLAEPMLKSLGKPLSELLDLVLKRTGVAEGVPQRLRLTNWNARTGSAEFHGLTKAGQKFEATPTQLDELINGGVLGVDQPPQGAVEAIRRKLAGALGPQRPPVK